MPPQSSQKRTRSAPESENMRGKRSRSEAMSASVMLESRTLIVGLVREARLADGAVPEALAQDIDRHDRGDDDEKDRARIGEIKQLDRGEQVVSDTAGADEADDRRAAHVQLEPPERVGHVVRNHLRQYGEADLLEPRAARGADPVDRQEADVFVDLGEELSLRAD